MPGLQRFGACTQDGPEVAQRPVVQASPPDSVPVNAVAAIASKGSSVAHTATAAKQQQHRQAQRSRAVQGLWLAIGGLITTAGHQPPLASIGQRRQLNGR